MILDLKNHYLDEHLIVDLISPFNLHLQQVEQRPGGNLIAQHHPHHGEALTDLFLEQFEPLKAFEYYHG
jgi:hypothetical protein